MRVKLSGPITLLTAIEAAAPDTPGITLEGAPQRRESAELRLDLKDVADLIAMAKDFADLVALCWSGVQVLRIGGISSEGRSAETQSSAARLEVTTAGRHIGVLISPETTREQLEAQLARLQSQGAP